MIESSYQHHEIRSEPLEWCVRRESEIECEWPSGPVGDGFKRKEQMLDSN